MWLLIVHLASTWAGTSMKNTIVDCIGWSIDHFWGSIETPRHVMLQSFEETPLPPFHDYVVQRPLLYAHQIMCIYVELVCFMIIITITLSVTITTSPRYVDSLADDDDLEDLDEKISAYR